MIETTILRTAALALAATLALPATLAAQDAVPTLRPEDTEVWAPAPPVVDPGPGPAVAAPPPSDAIVLFGGTDLDEWLNVRDGRPAGWTVEDGVLTVVKSVGDIQTRRRFRDYQLHLEWKVPENITGDGQGRGNSGLFLAYLGKDRGGYELQILDSYENETYVNGMAGSVYKQAAPLADASRPPGEWQTYDVVWTAPRFAADGALVSPARLTALHNGVLVQSDFELEGETVYRGEPEYRPFEDAAIMLQAHGDPSPPISFRNIWVRELDESEAVYADERRASAKSEIEEILRRLPAAWNARDADAWVASVGEDSGFTNILGMHFPDRAANRSRHAELFETIFADSRLEAEVLSVRVVGRDAAVAEVEFTLVGYHRLPPGVEETVPGVLRTRLVTVLERREVGWTIVAAQNTAILPVAVGRTSNQGGERGRVRPS